MGKIQGNEKTKEVVSLTITAETLRKLASLGLSTEQMSAVLEILADNADKEEERKKSQRERKRMSRDRHVTVTVTPLPLGSLSPKPPISPNPTPKEKPPKGVKKKSSLPYWMPIDAWDGFVEMRNKIKKPLTDRAMVLAVGKLERFRAMGHDPSEVLNQSTLNDWQDLYEPRKDNAHFRNNQKPTFSSERERLAAKYAAEAEREEQAALERNSGESLRITEAVWQDTGGT